VGDDSGTTDLSDVFITLFGNRMFWYFLIFVVVVVLVVRGYTQIEIIGEIGERLIRALRGQP